MTLDVLTINACKLNEYGNSDINSKDNGIGNLGINFNRETNTNESTDLFDKIKFFKFFLRFKWLKRFKT
ncbi:hypothetical protein A9G27_00130 [Gilliamella sp. Bim3-2]|nr:hypothetical protein A9G27_00130 [Gilliamella apicola]